MQRVAVTVVGVTPLLMSRFTDEAAMKATKGSSGALRGGSKTPQQEAEERIYRDETGRIIIPGPNMFRCIIDGGTFFKAGKSKVTTGKSSLIPACVSVEQLILPVKHKQPWRVDTRPVRNPATGGRFLCNRPCFEDWSLDFTLEVDTDLIAVDLVRDILDAAGKRVGLGDFRPAAKGPFGKFRVDRWELVK